VKCVIGRRYKTRFGWVRLRERDVDAVERSLLQIPPEVARPRFAAIMMCQGELLDALRRWQEEAARICMEKIGPGQVARAGVIYVNSCYRPLGTTAGSGVYADPCGAVDSTDAFGHWSGFAVDVPTRYFRLGCVPALTVEEINLAAERAGLERPFLRSGEWWHYRVRPGGQREGIRFTPTSLTCGATRTPAKRSTATSDRACVAAALLRRRDTTLVLANSPASSRRVVATASFRVIGYDEELYT